ncbi:MAG: response regulator [Desulfomicrobium escambiense]|nr:response regulator [Desulfomicrobium escambiense]
MQPALRSVHQVKLILLDLILPDGNGIEALKEIRSLNPDALVIITAHGRMESAIDAMKEGAYDYLEKPFDIEELKIVVEKAFGDISLREELHSLRQGKEEARPVPDRRKEQKHAENIQGGSERWRRRM